MSMFSKDLHVGGQVAAREDASVHLGVQGLHAAVEDLGEARDLADADGLHAAALEEFLRAARGDDGPTQFLQPLHERHEPGLVAYAD